MGVGLSFFDEPNPWRLVFWSALSPSRSGSLYILRADRALYSLLQSGGGPLKRCGAGLGLTAIRAVKAFGSVGGEYEVGEIPGGTFSDNTCHQAETETVRVGTGSG